MKTILCYGDSNTWGWNPHTARRYPKEMRWPTILQRKLGNEFDVIAEGLPGRTTVWDDPVGGEYKNGKKYLLPCLHSHKPVDVIVIMLGTNDLKHRFSLEAVDIAQGVEMLVDIVKTSCTGRDSKSPHVLVVIPPPTECIDTEDSVTIGGRRKSLDFPVQFTNILNNQCHLLDAGGIVKSSSIDGEHLEPQYHDKLANAVFAKIKEILQSF
ncbi:Lysophospholipase L1 [Peptoclostridium litorale DSM 5388]|uniref:Lipolytic protein G-D-S-L family n=1 Tax=Peptoclostridium litorale DSM 5388 TaxID=1121324 RepID=A0A069RB12_PEPLI|nr:SGNH/GDSL hydrolase family protein [Peptoclostridium litorale]KDR94216.1 lipolytic protein G-D-S-L family [Peptoclostridium litorale DSM 5388]SIN82420.1 Lysophospholipase L1 [Peptoclostridium litorale DSM 5388]